MAQRITLRREPRSWTATFHDDPQLARLMGTDTIPMPFSPETPAATVRQVITEANPSAVVVIEPDDIIGVDAEEELTRAFQFAVQQARRSGELAAEAIRLAIEATEDSLGEEAELDEWAAQAARVTLRWASQAACLQSRRTEYRRTGHVV